jgi:acetolactate synthase-1/3 small subunit
MKHLIAIIVNNKAGVLTRVASLFARRGFNIESLAVGPTELEEFSRITIGVIGDEEEIEQITKQLNKLPDTLKIFDMPEKDSVERDLIIIKVGVNLKTKAEISQLVETFGGKIAHSGKANLTIELCAEEKKIEEFIKLLTPFGIKELVRTGVIALLKE